tara:strand:+ start:569 stop:925 length:357 start_codon:yes stop_codon:yes gene_type:complete
MQVPICLSTHHSVIVLNYIDILLEFIEDISTIESFTNFKDVLDIIIEYNNNYKKDIGTGNFHDFLMIIPVQVSVMTNGYLAALENDNNRKKVRAYRYLISEQTQDLIEQLKELKTEYE